MNNKKAKGQIPTSNEIQPDKKADVQIIQKARRVSRNEEIKKDVVRRLSKFMNNKRVSVQNEHAETSEPVNPEEELPPRFLLSMDPNAPLTIMHHNYGLKKLERNETISNLTVHFSLESNLILNESDEHKLQEEILEERNKGIREVIKQHELSTLKNMGGANGGDAEENLRVARKIQRNKFNYLEIGTQSRTKTILEKGVSTSKPNLLKFSSEVNQADIYQTYLAKAKEELPEKLKEMKMQVSDNQVPQNTQTGIANPPFSRNFQRILKTMERMIIQNNNEDKFNDYKYIYRNLPVSKKTDEKIYPLWRFAYEPFKSCNVTCVKWNPRYQDLFAVGLGSYQFGKKPSETGVCLFSIKNPSYPESIWPISENVLCLDFNRSNASLLAVGLANGNVMVFDIRKKEKTPIYVSSLKTGKHSDAVWEVHWNEEKGKPNFNSISSDGKVFKWTLTKEKLECEEIFSLKYVDRRKKNSDQDENIMSAYGSGLCFDFSPFDKFLFLVGTEEGGVHLCSSAYSGEYQSSYEGHQLAVYRVRFSPFNSDVFVSASADWSVKVWRVGGSAAVMTFDLSQAIVDVTWSPFDSAVFICLSLEKLHVFDLGVNKYEPVAEIHPVDRKCTNLALSAGEPIVLVGDSNGGVSSFKLCGSLAKGEGDVSSEEFRQKQIEHLKSCLVLGSMID